MPKSDLEAEFKFWLSTEKLPKPLEEHVFAPPRKWRFDFAWPGAMVAVEVEGGVWTSGRHTRGSGFLADCEKYEAAHRFGWTVYRVPGVWILDGDRRIWRPEVTDTLRMLIARGEGRAET